jgi:hypothetical protein
MCKHVRHVWHMPYDQPQKKAKNTVSLHDFATGKKYHRSVTAHKYKPDGARPLNLAFFLIVLPNISNSYY